MGAPGGTVFEVRLRGLVNAQQTLNVLHYRVQNPSALASGGPEETALFAALTIGATSITTKYLACISPDFTLQSMDVQRIGPPRWINVRNGIALPGTFAGACDAQNVSGVITKYTETAGRSKIGSVHIPGLSKTSYLLGGLTAGLKAVMTTFAAALLNLQSPALGGGTYQPVIFHRGDPHHVPPIPNSTDEFLSASVQDTLRVMRRRTIGVGK